MPEKKHYLILDEVIKKFPHFNLYPKVIKSQHTSSIQSRPEYRSYLSKTLEVSYESWDGKKEYGGPYIYGNSNSGNKTSEYFVVWVKE